MSHSYERLTETQEGEGAPEICPATARAAALRIVPHLDLPSVLEFVVPRELNTSGPSLFLASPQKPVIATPTALFSLLRLAVTEVPAEWLLAYVEWSRKVQRSEEFVKICCGLDNAEPFSKAVDPVVAGLLLYLKGGSVDSSLRQPWLELARSTPAGAWLAAEGLHRLDEREAIVEAVSSDSRLLWWTSQVPGLGRLAAKHAQGRLDFYAGLILAANGEAGEFEDWLCRASHAGRECATAAAAMLILRPDASDRNKAGWIATWQNETSGRCPYETVRWARHTWPAEQWEKLRTELRAHAVADHGQWFCQWFRDVEPGQARAALGAEGLDTLWGVELLDALDEVDDYPFRFQLGERLGTLGDQAVSLVLRWLNERSRRHGGSAP
jgi:hypothetical protein